MKSAQSVRRGPTLRGGRFRPAIGRSVRVSQQQQTSSDDDDEERIGLTNAAATDNNNEKLYFETIENIGDEYNEKLQTDDQGKPVYHHGTETFGDILTHPREELHAHKTRRQTYKSRVGQWSALHSSNDVETGQQPPNR